MKYEQSNHDKSANRITPNLTSNSIPNPQNLALNFDTPLPSKERKNVENVNMNTEMSANFDYDDGMRNETGQEEDEMMVEGIRIKKKEKIDEEDEEGFMENQNKDELHLQVTGKMFSQVATNQLCNFPKVRLSETPQAAIGPKL